MLSFLSIFSSPSKNSQELIDLNAYLKSIRTVYEQNKTLFIETKMPMALVLKFTVYSVKASFDKAKLLIPFLQDLFPEKESPTVNSFFPEIGDFLTELYTHCQLSDTIMSSAKQMLLQAILEKSNDSKNLISFLLENNKFHFYLFLLETIKDLFNSPKQSDQGTIVTLFQVLSFSSESKKIMLDFLKKVVKSTATEQTSLENFKKTLETMEDKETHHLLSALFATNQTPNQPAAPTMNSLMLRMGE